MGSTGLPPGTPLDIPDFNYSGVLPPFLGSTPAIPAMMSPYLTTLKRVAEKLCGTNERKEIFRGLLKFRDHLQSIGLVDGFQWLSGSFLDNIEALESRAPKDVDVVTFFYRPTVAKADKDFGVFANTNRNTFTPQIMKMQYKCDAYFVDLDVIPTTTIVDQTRYWFGLFSHRRAGEWKGILQVPLMISQDDADAAKVVGP
jgi:hypothetical protein